MEGAEHFDFFRQPDFVKEPFLKGSYAVYKKETLLGEGTGKLCHIHRPEIIDARGRRCWGDLSISGNRLCITIPEKWLSEATYPVVVDPTVGTTTVGSQITGPNPDNTTFDRPLLDGHIGVCKSTVPQNGKGQCMAYVYAYYHEWFFEGATPVLFTDKQNKPYWRISKKQKIIDITVEPWSNPRWCTNTFQIDGEITAGSNVWFGVQSSYFSTRFDYGGDCYKFCNDEDYWLDDDLPEYVEIDTRWDTYQNIKFSWYFSYTGITSLNYVRTITQGVSLTDSRKLKASYKRSTTQTARVNSACSRFEGFYRNCAMTVYNTLNVGRFPEFIRRITEDIRLTAAKSENCSLTRVCSDNANAFTENKTFLSICREIRDGLKGTDTQTVSVLIMRSVADYVAITQHTRHWGAFIRGLLVTAGNIDEIGHKAEYYRFNTDTVQAEGKAIRGLIVFIRIIAKALVRNYVIWRFLKAKKEIVLKSPISREIILDSKLS
jgi:hypothetical protein